MRRASHLSPLFIGHVVTMAGEIRQPVDIVALEKYIEEKVPEIGTPLEVKQVRNITT